MQAGYSKIDITPPLGANLNGYYRERFSDHVIEPLYVTTVAYSDGINTVLTISLDISEILQKDTNEIRMRVSTETGVPFEAVYIACIHTHTAPVISEIPSFFTRDESYYQSFVEKICHSAKEAIKDLSDAQAYYSKGKAEGISFIRRFRRKDGSAVTNPKLDDMDQIAGPIGTPDESVTLIKLERDQKSEILIVSFASHPDVIGGTGICPDWPGFMRDAVEKALDTSANGKGVNVIFFNGAQGDVNHHDKMNGVVKKGVEHSKHMGRVLAGAVLSIYTYMTPISSERVFFGQDFAQVAVAKGSDKDVEIATEIQEKFLKYEDISSYPFSIVMARKYLRLKECGAHVDLNLVCVGFDEVAFVGIPGEPFTEIGREIKKQSPFSITIPCCNANGSEGYFPTDEALSESGYESQSSLFLPGVGTKIIETSLSLLNKLKNKA